MQCVRRQRLNQIPIRPTFRRENSRHVGSARARRWIASPGVPACRGRFSARVETEWCDTGERRWSTTKTRGGHSQPPQLPPQWLPRRCKSAGVVALQVHVNV